MGAYVFIFVGPMLVELESWETKRQGFKEFSGERMLISDSRDCGTILDSGFM